MLSHHVKESNCTSASVGGFFDHVHLLVGLSRTITTSETGRKREDRDVEVGETLMKWILPFCLAIGIRCVFVSHSLMASVDELHP